MKKLFKMMALAMMVAVLMMVAKVGYEFWILANFLAN